MSHWLDAQYYLNSLLEFIGAALIAIACWRLYRAYGNKSLFVAFIGAAVLLFSDMFYLLLGFAYYFPFPFQAEVLNLLNSDGIWNVLAATFTAGFIALFGSLAKRLHLGLRNPKAPDP